MGATEKTADVMETMELPVEDDEIVVMDEHPADMLMVMEPQAEPEKEFDPEKNRDMKKLIPYLQKLLTSIPKHSGQTTAGCERAHAHLDAADKLISKMIAMDEHGEVDDLAVEQVRKQIRKMKKQLKKKINDLNDAYDADDEKFAATEGEVVKTADKASNTGVLTITAIDPSIPLSINTTSNVATLSNVVITTTENKADVTACACKAEKSAESTKLATPEDGKCPKCKIDLWKAAEGLYECLACDGVYEGALKKEAGVPRIQLVMTPFERAISGILVNAYVSQGKNIEDVYAELKKQYKFSERDELSIQQLMVDMGYPVARNFMGAVDGNVEFATNYHA